MSSKTNDPQASLRSGNLPKSEAVKTAQVKNAGSKQAQKQNTSVIPTTGPLAPLKA